MKWIHRWLFLGLILAPALAAAQGTPGGPPAGQAPASDSSATGALGDSAAQADSAPDTVGVPPAPFAIPEGLTVADTRNDDGESLTLKWRPVPGVLRYRVERTTNGVFEPVSVAGKAAVTYDDESAEDGVAYRYRLVAIGPNGEEGVSAVSNAAVSSAQWFNTDLVGVLIAVALFAGLVMFFIRRARQGLSLFIRRLAGLEAVDEAIGRATEMGRSVLYVSGIGDISYISIIASLNVLGEIAKKTARYGTKLTVPNYDPIVYTVAREVVKGAYTEVGRPDAYDPNSVFFVVQNQMAYAAAVSGIMTRDKPAANFLLGYFSGESLILAETGAATGAIQIAGTDMTTQLPFFVVACDYTLLGEELYAASAYLSREPLMLGALKGQDWSKVFFIAILVLGTVAALATGWDARVIFNTSGH